jgi:hypothetical protein
MNYKELIVRQKTHALTLEVICSIDNVKRSYAGEIAIRQLIRAITSIGANTKLSS